MSTFDATPAQIAKLVAGYPLAWVVSAGAHGFAATPLPLLGEFDAEGRIAALFGHFARANPQVALLERDPRATILFMGPQGYVSPGLVSKPDWGATWNYAVARFDVEIGFVPEETGESVERLADFVERDRADPWHPDRMGERRATLQQHIVAFRGLVRATHARFKLGQDETPAILAEIVSGLGDTDLARWMTDAVSPPARS